MSLEFSPDGKWLASASGRGEDVVKVWDVEAGELRFTNGRQERRIAIGIGGPGDLAFSPDSKLLATCVSSNDPEYEGSVTELWEVATGERRHWWPSHLGTTVNFSPDGLWVVFYDDSATQLANPVTGQIEATLGGLSGADRLFELGWDSDCESAHRPAQQSETEVLGILGITPMVA